MANASLRYRPWVLGLIVLGFSGCLSIDAPETSSSDKTIEEMVVPEGFEYQTSRGLPWTIQLPVSFDYPLEEVPVPSAHLKFIDWVESGGASFDDWYESKPGYRDVNDIW